MVQELVGHCDTAVGNVGGCLPGSIKLEDGVGIA